MNLSGLPREREREREQAPRRECENGGVDSIESSGNLVCHSEPLFRHSERSRRRSEESNSIESKNTDSIESARDLIESESIDSISFKTAPFLLLVKFFEVHKKLYLRYKIAQNPRAEKILRAFENDSFTNIEPYLFLAKKLENEIIKESEISKFQALSTLSKLNDTLIGGFLNLECKDKFDIESEIKLNNNNYQKILDSIDFELNFICDLLCEKFEIKRELNTQNLSKILDILKQKNQLKSALKNYLEIDNKIEPQIRANVLISALKEYKIKDFALFYTPNARSEIYLNSLKNASILPSLIIFLSNNKTEQSIKELHLQNIKNLNIKIDILECENINSDIAFIKISQISQKVVIFSGSGILGVRYFAPNLPKILHAHPGSLGAYAGSTTCYYELLEAQRIGACAMFLRPLLDRGEVLARQIYPINCLKNIESFSQNLVKNCENFIEFILRFNIENIELSEREPFYKIHPILKNIAILMVHFENSTEN